MNDVGIAILSSERQSCLFRLESYEQEIKRLTKDLDRVRLDRDDTVRFLDAINELLPADITGGTA